MTPTQAGEPLRFVDLMMLFDALPLDELEMVRDEIRSSPWLPSDGSSKTKRVRSMPRLVMFCFVVLRWIHKDPPDAELLRHIVEGLAQLGIADFRGLDGKVKEGFTKPAISKARARLGWREFDVAACGVCCPVHSGNGIVLRFRQWRGVSIDSATFPLHAVPANKAAFGIQDGKNLAAIQISALIEHGTGMLFGAEMGRITHRPEITSDCLQSLRKTMICLGGPETFSYSICNIARLSEAPIIWQVPENLHLPFVKGLFDGTYMTELYASLGHYRQGLWPLSFRVIEFIDTRAPSRPPIRLITTLLNAKTAPAKEIATFFRTRKTICGALESTGIKDPSRDIDITSRTPDLVRQEIYGLLFAQALLCRVRRGLNEYLEPGFELLVRDEIKLVRHRAEDLEASPTEDSFIV